MYFKKKPDRRVGDLYWEQLSMWDRSPTDAVDMYSEDGFHFELRLITEVRSATGWSNRFVMWDELTSEQIEGLVPQEGHNWSRIMGNVEDFS